MRPQGIFSLYVELRGQVSDSATIVPPEAVSEYVTNSGRNWPINFPPLLLNALQTNPCPMKSLPCSRCAMRSPWITQTTSSLRAVRKASNIIESISKADGPLSVSDGS